MTTILRKVFKPMMVLMIFLCASIVALSQGSISGTITDSSGAPIANASVTVKGTRNGVRTDANGRFTINAPLSSTLIVSSVGFTNQEIAVNGRNSITTTLQQNASQLNEVVVVAYGTRRRGDVTGSVTTVSAKDFQKGTITTPEQLIAGKVAGVSIISNGGAPGAGSTIRIRGGSSLRASNDPLIVIDGVPIDGGNLSFINPNDVESFTVLKDASAAAIYGARAANGVILITTKKGRSDKFRIGFSTLNSVAQIRDKVEVLSGDEIRSIVNAQGSAAQKASLGKANTDWQDQIYQSAFTTDNNITLSGGVKKLPYRLSFGYLNQEGVLKTDELERFSLGVAVNPTFLNNHLRVDLNVKASVQNNHYADQGAIGNAVFFDPTQPVFSGDNKRFGGYYEYMLNGVPNPDLPRNPMSQLYGRDANGKTRRSIGNIQVDYKFHFLPELRANINLGYDVSRFNSSTFISDSSSLAYNVRGFSSKFESERNNSVFEAYLAYASELKSLRSRFDVLAGYAYNNFQYTDYFFPSFNARGVMNPGSEPPFPFNTPEKTVLSYFSRLNFNFLDKYLLTATIRRDASSVFGETNRWGTFPSAALSWRVSQESFLRNSKVLSDLKLRLGYGITGQSEGIGLYDYLAVYGLSNSTASYQFGNSFYQMLRPSGYNPSIKWEETETTNIGLDYGFFGGRVSGTIDYYIKKTSDLLNSVPQAAGTNFSAYQTENVGDMENEGVEFNLNLQPVKNDKTTLDVGFNVTYNKNVITNLTEVKNDPNYPGFPTGGVSGSNGFAFLNAVGRSRSTFYLFKQVYDVNGKPIEGLFEDINRDGVITGEDRYLSKQSDPNVFMGLSTNLSMGKWSAGFVMRGSFNNYVFNNFFSANGRMSTILGGRVVGNASRNYLETGFRGNTEFQGLSDYYLENASFVRMDNFNVGYNFGKVLRDRANLRASFSVQNVFIISNYKGLDPEIGNGIDISIYPRPRIYSLGLNLDL
jgi:TonB-dependent starch-binding outer membrane protein SusC